MKAILQVADQGPLESIVVMLRSIGIECLYPCFNLRQELRRIGMTLVLEIESLVKGMGYDRPFDIPPAELSDMERGDIIYVDVKAHRDYSKVTSRWPNLKNRVLWYRIQGGQPEHVVNARGDHGNEVSPPCPILTPNLWYREPGPWGDMSYSCWPPFYRFNEYCLPRPPTELYTFQRPICLTHNLVGWGYGGLIEEVRKLGVICYGNGSPDGLIQHQEVRPALASALALVHLKSSDAPGYSLYEALASGCPVVCSRRLIWRNRMQDLFIPGETCLVFDRETHEGLTDAEVISCKAEIQLALSKLANPVYNRKIGQAGKEKLRQLMWSKDRSEDVASLRAFLDKVIR